MKTAKITVFLLLVLSFALQGQWFQKKYNVSEISYLSKEQLDESLSESKAGLLTSGMVSVAGAGVFLAGRFLPYEIDDESSFFEQLLGEKGMKKMLMAAGTGMAAGGAVAAIVYLGRMAKIRSVINEYYAFTMPFRLEPALIINRELNAFTPGITLTCNF